MPKGTTSRPANRDQKTAIKSLKKSANRTKNKSLQTRDTKAGYKPNGSVGRSIRDVLSHPEYMRIIGESADKDTAAAIRKGIAAAKRAKKGKK